MFILSDKVGAKIFAVNITLVIIWRIILIIRFFVCLFFQVVKSKLMSKCVFITLVYIDVSAKEKDVEM